MEWSPDAVPVEFYDVPQRHCFSMLLSILYFNTLLAMYTEVKYQTFFFINSKFDELMSEICNVLQKGELNLTV